jgi:hypothetical protein
MSTIATPPRLDSTIVMTGVKRILSKNIGTTDERRQIIMD